MVDMYEKAMKVIKELFARDYQFAMATAHENSPSVRFVDTFYEDGSFFVVTYAKARLGISRTMMRAMKVCVMWKLNSSMVSFIRMEQAIK